MAQGDAAGESRRSGNETHSSTSRHPVTRPPCHAIPGANLAFPPLLSVLVVALVSQSVDSFSFEAEVEMFAREESEVSWFCLVSVRLKGDVVSWALTRECSEQGRTGRKGTVLSPSPASLPLWKGFIIW